MLFMIYIACSGYSLTGHIPGGIHVACSWYSVFGHIPAGISAGIPCYL